jgi:hypothetical protein
MIRLIHHSDMYWTPKHIKVNIQLHAQTKFCSLVDTHDFVEVDSLKKIDYFNILSTQKLVSNITSISNASKMAFKMFHKGG